LKVPRQCPLVLLVEVRLGRVKRWEMKRSKGLGCRFCYEQRREVRRALLRMVEINFDIVT
jgi:hypothetical protein